MFYKSSDLSKLKSQAAEVLPIYYDDIFFYHPFHGKPIMLKNLMLFKKSITIPPHALVTDNNPSHHYSYSRDNKIGFHSDPINLENSKSQHFYSFLQEVLTQQRKESENLIESNFNLLPELFALDKNATDFIDILEASIKRVSIVEPDTSVNSIIEKLDTTDKLLILEDILYQYFNIRQFITYDNL